MSASSTRPLRISRITGPIRVKMLGNVKEGRPVKYLNLPAEDLKNAAIAQLKAGEPVWFGCDVGQCSIRDGGIMDLDAVCAGELSERNSGMDKAERLDYGESLMTHAMVFQGVNLDEAGKPTRWRVENSWGKEAGAEGYYVMSDEWFTEYTYQVVVHKKVSHGRTAFGAGTGPYLAGALGSHGVSCLTSHLPGRYLPAAVRWNSQDLPLPPVRRASF